MAEESTALVVVEVATADRDPYLSQFTGILSPQDETILAKGMGKGVQLYDEIRRDPHAFAVLQKRSLEVSSREWMVVAASERRVDERAAEFVKRQLKGINFDRLTNGMMAAVLKGYAVAEVIWELRGGEWWVARVKVKKQRRFRFHSDGSLRMLTRGNMVEGETVPDRKFIVHRYAIDHTDDDPYGLGLGNVLYWPAWFKRQVLAHWLQAGERHASPTIKATYQGAYDAQRQAQILQAIRTMARDAGIVVPQGVTIELLESARGGGGDLLEKLSRYLDEMMSEAVLGETLSTNSGERGARSLGEIHNDVRLAIAKADADLLSGTFNDTLVRWIIDANAIPIGDGYPAVWRDFAQGEDLDARVKRDKTIFEMGFEPAEDDYFDETYGGEWRRKAKLDETDPAEAGAIERTAALFAEGALPEDPALTIAEQLDELAAPVLDELVARVRRELAQASSYADFAERLLQLSGSVDPSALGQLMEDAMVVADLAGRAEVMDGR